MSESAVQEFFKNESLLNITMGQDGLLGFFASNYPTIVGMTRAIQHQEMETWEKQGEAQTELDDLRDELEHLDSLLSQHGYLEDDDQARYEVVIKSIDFYEKEVQKQDRIFYGGKQLKMCPEVEFISKVNNEFPGLLEAICEFDRLLRIPIAKVMGKGLGWALTPLKLVVGTIVQRTNLGVAGNLIYMLVDKYPDLIRQRMEAQEPEDAPDDCDEMELKGYSVKEEKHEVIKKYKHYPKKDDD